MSGAGLGEAVASLCLLASLAASTCFFHLETISLAMRAMSRLALERRRPTVTPALVDWGGVSHLGVHYGRDGGDGGRGREKRRHTRSCSSVGAVSFLRSSSSLMTIGGASEARALVRSFILELSSRSSMVTVGGWCWCGCGCGCVAMGEVRGGRELNGVEEQRQKKPSTSTPLKDGDFGESRWLPKLELAEQPWSLSLEWSGARLELPACGSRKRPKVWRSAESGPCRTH